MGRGAPTASPAALLGTPISTWGPPTCRTHFPGPPLPSRVPPRPPRLLPPITSPISPSFPGSRPASPSPAWGPPALPDTIPGSPITARVPPQLLPSFPGCPIPVAGPPIPSRTPPRVPPSLPGSPHPFLLSPLSLSRRPLPGPPHPSSGFLSKPPHLCPPSPSLGSPCPSRTAPGPSLSPGVPPPAGVPPSGVSLSAQPPGAQVALGDRLVLSCAVAAGTGALSFSWHREGSAAPLGTGPRLELRRLGDNDSGRYRCRVSDGDSAAESDALNVTVLVPVANATITPGPLAHPVPAGDPVTLRCSVQVGSAPVTFTWLHNGQEVARGPLLELGDIEVGHSGTYQCVATNQLGQDGHRVFRALSTELALEVTTWGQRNTAVAAGVGGSLLALVLLVGGIVGWQRCHRRGG
ncbi:hypothetical protein DV515_00019071 [Chloebia gouldiae]|uniref:Ig-like domain-containing protein n=1 Tax=Chloebia gouldiae TaxID=44316 RepID=A0A3L8Q5S1_CHLGU|nr:hypothetical protein DV515_00019071 [Chloebia gouldiae]